MTVMFNGFAENLTAITHGLTGLYPRSDLLAF